MLKSISNQKLSISFSVKISFFLFLASVIAPLSSVKAQYRKLVSEPSRLSLKTNELDSTFNTKRYALGLNMGLPTGIGIEGAYRLSSRWGARAGFNFADLSVNQYKITFTSTSTGTLKKESFLIDLNIKMSQFPITFEFYPNGRDNFKILGGIQYIPVNKISVSGQLDSIVKFNDVPISSSDLGSGTVTMSFSLNVVPFLGIGFGRTFPEKRFSFGCDISASYRNEYRFFINVKQGIILKSNEENSTVLERNFNHSWYQKIWPMLNIRLSYRI